MLVGTQGTEDGVGGAAHTTLQRQKLLGDATGVQLVDEELGGEVADTVGHRVAVLEGAGLVGDVALHHTHELLLRNGHIGHTDAVAHLGDGNGLAVGRVERLIHVVEELGVGVVEGVELQNDMLGQTGCCGADAAGSGKVSLVEAVGLLNVAHLENSPVDVTVEAVAQLLCHMAQVKVVVGNLAHVHMFAEVGVGGVGSAVFESLCIGQVTVGALSGGGTGEDAHFEGTSGFVLSLSDFGQLFGHGFGHSGGSEATHCNIFSVFNQRRSLDCGHKCVRHIILRLVIIWPQRYSKSSKMANYSYFIFPFFLSCRFIS